jgi:hypothetical protein
MKKNILKVIGSRFCVAEIEIENGRFSLCGTEGRIVRISDAKREALQYWESFFQESPEERQEMNKRCGCNCRTAKSAARFVIQTYGELHGLDVYRENDTKVFITESCGQIRETLAEWFPWLMPFFDYHLNDMHAGTLEQEAELERAKADGRLPVYDYAKACDVLKAAGLYEVPTGKTNRVNVVAGDGGNVDVPEMYTYGHSWLKRDIPDDLERQIENAQLAAAIGIKSA